MNNWSVTRVTIDNVAAFVTYCRAHGAEHDESFLPQDDFVPTEEYPAYLLKAGQAAIRLYLGEGFQKKSVMVCYRWRPDDLGPRA